jgi:hypothetical protein
MVGVKMTSPPVARHDPLHGAHGRLQDAPRATDGGPVGGLGGGPARGGRGGGGAGSAFVIV